MFRASPPPSWSAGALMLVHSHSFVVSNASGDIDPLAPHGFFVGDTRFVSHLRLRLDGQPLEVLATDTEDAMAAALVLRSASHWGHGDLLVIRRRVLGLALREDVEIRNHSSAARPVVVSMAVDADFSDIFSVKEGRVVAGGDVERLAHGHALRLVGHGEPRRAVEMSFHGAGLSTDIVGPIWRTTVPARSSITLSWEASVSFGGAFLTARRESGEPRETMPSVARARDWGAALPAFEADDHRLEAAVGRACEDLGALRLFDPDEQRRPAIAAGAPWFMTLFGRDSLLAAWMALPAAVDLALGVLETLAMMQSRSVDAARDAEPGKILHELRFTSASRLGLLHGDPYYGTVDASPLFVMLLAEAARWGAPMDEVATLLPAADAALDWVERTRSPYLAYERAARTGLANQGWKDSWDGVRYADGSVAEAPLALCEVQAYVYGAHVARAELADWTGIGDADDWRGRAAVLREQFDRDFWVPERSCYAIALDGEGRAVDSVTSNPGHCLWTGIASAARTSELVTTLLSPGMWTGWGVRTHSSADAGYDPLSYHCGSVWPHDNALLAAGLCRYGLVSEAHRITDGLLDVAVHLDGRLPELLCGIDRADVRIPVDYPTSCLPQAWAAASPLLLLRSLLGLEPCVPERRVAYRPRVPATLGDLSWRGIRMGEARLDVEVRRGSCSIGGLGAGWELEELVPPPSGG